jgi:hypothetical protein
MAEWARNTESETRVWMMVGVLVRVALQMGYHRLVSVLECNSMPDFSAETLRITQKLPSSRARCAGGFGVLCKDSTP